MLKVKNRKTVSGPALSWPVSTIAELIQWWRAAETDDGVANKHKPKHSVATIFWGDCGASLTRKLVEIGVGRENRTTSNTHEQQRYVDLRFMAYLMLHSEAIPFCFHNCTGVRPWTRHVWKGFYILWPSLHIFGPTAHKVLALLIMAVAVV